MSIVKCGESLVDLLLQIDGLKYSQFTIDWLEESCDVDFDDPVLTEQSYVGAMKYRVENLLEILDEALPDYALFIEIKAWIDSLYKP